MSNRIYRAESCLTTGSVNSRVYDSYSQTATSCHLSHSKICVPSSEIKSHQTHNRKQKIDAFPFASCEWMQKSVEILGAIFANYKENGTEERKRAKINVNFRYRKRIVSSVVFFISLWCVILMVSCFLSFAALISTVQLRGSFCVLQTLLLGQDLLQVSVSYLNVNPLRSVVLRKQYCARENFHHFWQPLTTYQLDTLGIKALSIITRRAYNGCVKTAPNTDDFVMRPTC